MTYRFFSAFICTIIFSTFSSTASLAQSEADPAVYGALPAVTDVEISPDGTTVAMVQIVDGANYVVFRSLANLSETIGGMRLEDVDIRSIEWANDDYLLLMYSQSEKEQLVDGMTTIEYFRWVSIAKQDQNAIVLFGNEGNFIISDPGSFIGMQPGAENVALFARYSPRGKYNPNNRASRIRGQTEIAYSAFTANLETGRTQLVAEGNDGTRQWLPNKNGEPFLRVDYNTSEETRELYIRNAGQSDFKLLRSFDEPRGAGSVIRFHGLLDGGTHVAATTYGDRDKRSVIAIDLATGDTGRTLFSDPLHDIDRVIFDPTNAEAIGVRYVDNLPRTYYFNDQFQNIQQQLAGALPGAAPMIVSKSRNGRRMIVQAIYTDHPKQYFVFDRSSMRLDMVAPSYSKLDGVVYAAKERFDYESTDGLTIPGYLAAPASSDRQNMPLIVLPHGGPETRADQSFDYWSFFYAARGYLVYEPNFRGSDGYGFNFRSAGYGEWGRKMQDDITEGVQKLIADGIADPDRICIVGGSYGGYAALAGATLTPDLYACAVSVNGVSDLPGMLGDESKESPLAEDYWEVRMGGDRFSPEELNAVSPSEIADRTGPPIMLIHAKDDIVVPISQSRRMRNALRSAGKPYEYVELKGEDHWLSTGEMRTEMLRRSIEFIDTHIGQ
ncbi:MAG: S9 family peptidase [Pseudomonadota bacterium]